jgi:hypothetical protein
LICRIAIPHDSADFAGNCTATGSDTITITAPGSVSFEDVYAPTWVLSNLNSTTPISSNEVASNSVISTTCTTTTPGNFVFAIAANNSASSYSGSAQTPAHSANQAGSFSHQLYGDWTANGTGCSGGTFTATDASTDAQTIVVYH